MQVRCTETVVFVAHFGISFATHDITFQMANPLMVLRILTMLMIMNFKVVAGDVLAIFGNTNHRCQVSISASFYSLE